MFVVLGFEFESNCEMMYSFEGGVWMMGEPGQVICDISDERRELEKEE